MDSFLASQAPDLCKIFGVKLKRLTFGHVVLLNRFDLDPVDTVLDLALAVQICSRDFNGALSYVDSLGSKWRTALNWAFARRVRNWDIEQALEGWQEYLELNSFQPKYAESNGPPSDKGAPALAQIRAFLISQCNYSPETLNDQFYGQCLWDFGAVMESNIGEGIVGEHHNRIAELLKN